MSSNLRADQARDRQLFSSCWAFSRLLSCKEMGVHLLNSTLRPCLNSPLTHLRTLEAESIHIMREVVAEFARPVMLYSIGKDSSVMVRLAQKAFYPGKIPFPLLHIDTTYKFQEMIEFRDNFAREIGAQLIVHTNRKAIDEGANPFRLGTQKCCGLLKTRALLDALAEGGFDVAFGGARRDEEKSRAKERIFSFRDQYGQWDPKNQRPGAVEPLQRPHRQGREHSRLSAVELDRAGCLAVHPRGEYSDRAAVLRQGTAHAGARRVLCFRSSTTCRCCPASSRK